MRIVLIAIALSLGVALAHAQREKTKEQRAQEDIAIHRAIAAAHEKAATCLESGRSEKQCHAHFATECRGIALGRYCGMRHRH